MLVVGYGVHIAEANQQLRDLAEMWYLPVATSYKGKSTIAENHPLALSIVRVYGQPVANQVVGEGDTVIIVGTNLSPQDTMRESPKVFILVSSTLSRSTLNTGTAFSQRESI